MTPESDRAELHQDRGRPVVPEDELGAAPRDRRLAAHRIPRDVELVRLVSDELHAGEEGGVVQGRRDLADAPSDRVLQPSGEDLRRGDEAVLDRALAERLVQRERRARPHDRPVEQLGRPLDVGHARLAALVVGRELRDQLLDLERLGLLRRERGRRLHELRPVHRRVEVRGQRPRDPLEIERPPGLRRDDTGSAARPRRSPRRAREPPSRRAGCGARRRGPSGRATPRGRRSRAPCGRGRAAAAGSASPRRRLPGRASVARAAARCVRRPPRPPPSSRRDRPRRRRARPRPGGCAGCGGGRRGRRRCPSSTPRPVSRRRRSPPRRPSAGRRSGRRSGSRARPRAPAQAGTTAASSGPSRTPRRASTRSVAPASSAVASASSIRAVARSSAPLVVIEPLSAVSAMRRVSCCPASRSSAARAASSSIPPTSTPPIVVPRGIASRSRSATIPNAAARAARTASDDGEDRERAAPTPAGPRRGREERPGHQCLTVPDAIAGA